MTLSDRIISYLKHRNEWVTQEVLERLAQSHGYHSLAIKDALRKIQHLPNIGYFYDRGYHWYDVSREEQALWYRADEWWESGKTLKEFCEEVV
jgi:hypothetical protein